MDEVLKDFINQQLYDELSHVEIIPYNNSIWFIDREEKYWYFHLSNTGCLYWRYSYFPQFFKIFGMGHSQFEPILSEWVEEVLNHKVSTTFVDGLSKLKQVEEVLNHKVSTTDTVWFGQVEKVEEVLNHKVSTTSPDFLLPRMLVEEVLNHKVSTTRRSYRHHQPLVEEVLNHKVFTTEFDWDNNQTLVEEVLNNTEENG